MTTLAIYTNGIGSLTGDMLDTFEQTTNLATDLRSFTGVSSIQVFVRGLNAIGDGGQGVYYWSPTSTATDNLVSIIAPTGSTQGRWIRLGYLSPVSVGIGNGAMSVVTNYTALRALTTPGSAAVFVLGLATPCDGGQGIYWYDAADLTTPDNNGTVLRGTILPGAWYKCL